ncbi:MAG: hypothetical protein QXQ48_08730 [Nitrososphaerota archaeon]
MLTLFSKPFMKGGWAYLIEALRGIRENRGPKTGFYPEAIRPGGVI